MKKRYTNLFHEITTEKLSGDNASLTSFIFHWGGNCYAFSYKKEGIIKHTLIDAGDMKYRDQIGSILLENGINPVNIERIIITHSHRDHCGLDGVLAKISGAEIIVHHEFKRLIEGDLSKEQRMWLGKFDPKRLRRLRINYLHESTSKTVNICGVDFPLMSDPIAIGDGGAIEVLGCPKSELMHTPDQLLIIYRPNPRFNSDENMGYDNLPTDSIIFSGDLWLMKGPMNDMTMVHLWYRFRLKLRRIKFFLSGRQWPIRNHQEQDSDAKEALKRGFVLIRVKPGHHREFLGSRIIPFGIMSDRDILIELGYPESEISIIDSKEMQPVIRDILDKAYNRFTDELNLWLETRYSVSDVADLLARIYLEQSGGGGKIEHDRKQRRIRMKYMLKGLKNSVSHSSELKEIAALSLKKIEKIR